jgi:MOSC domain-containing protein YiiM
MYGVPSGVVFDPAGTTQEAGWLIEDGFLLAAGDIALARPPRRDPAAMSGTVQALWIATAAGKPARRLQRATALAGRGLEGDRHVAGTGTFPSGLPGSALTLIETEVCESFAPPLAADEHRRNIVTQGIDLSALVGYEFVIGAVRCRGMRLCEPCTVIESYSTRPILRSLIHRGGLRADILCDGDISVGDLIRSIPDS